MLGTGRRHLSVQSVIINAQLEGVEGVMSQSNHSSQSNLTLAL